MRAWPRRSSSCAISARDADRVNAPVSRFSSTVRLLKMLRRIAEVLRSVDEAIAVGQKVAEQAQALWNYLQAQPVPKAVPNGRAAARPEPR